MHALSLMDKRILRTTVFSECLWVDCEALIERAIAALAVTFRPDGNEIAVCDLNCRIQFFDPVSTQQVGIIEAKADLGNFRREDDLVSGKTASKGRYVIVRTIFCFPRFFYITTFFSFRLSRAFTTLCYSADGNAILVGGKSKYICVYHTKEHVLLRRFAVSKNWSFTGMTVNFFFIFVVKFPFSSQYSGNLSTLTGLILIIDFWFKVNLLCYSFFLP